MTKFSLLLLCFDQDFFFPLMTSTEKYVDEERKMSSSSIVKSLHTCHAVDQLENFADGIRLRQITMITNVISISSLDDLKMTFDDGQVSTQTTSSSVDSFFCFSRNEETTRRMARFIYKYVRISTHSAQLIFVTCKRILPHSNAIQSSRNASMSTLWSCRIPC